MKLSAPKKVTWWIAVVVGVLGILGQFMSIHLLAKIRFGLLQLLLFYLLSLLT